MMTRLHAAIRTSVVRLAPGGADGAGHVRRQRAHTQVHEAYRHADLLVNASLTEALGMPILEGMAAVVPVSAPRSGGIPELIRHEQTGLLFQPGDSAGLATPVVRLVNDAELRARMAADALRFAHGGFSWGIGVGLLDEYQGCSMPDVRLLRLFAHLQLGR
ncbi:MAG: glycosyltransferase family 4 protein [Caldilineaceae bacterium]